MGRYEDRRDLVVKRLEGLGFQPSLSYFATAKEMAEFVIAIGDDAKFELIRRWRERLDAHNERTKTRRRGQRVSA